MNKYGYGTFKTETPLEEITPQMKKMSLLSAKRKELGKLLTERDEVLQRVVEMEAEFKTLKFQPPSESRGVRLKELVEISQQNEKTMNKISQEFAKLNREICILAAEVDSYQHSGFTPQ